MKIAIHPGIIGKPAKDSGINLGYGWITEDIEWDAVFDLITVDGFATAAALNSNNRKDCNFVSRELIMVDIDAGMTIPDLLQDNFYNACGAGFYATPSFTLEHHKFRILFRLQTPITDANKLRKVNRALLKVFAQGDQACKDPARLFYGSPNCQFKEKRDNLLTDDVVAELCNMIDLCDEQEMKAHASGPVEYAALTDERKQQILDLLKGTYVGSYPIWRNVGWGLKQGGFTLRDFQYVTAGMMKQKSPADAAKIWNAGQADGDVTMGSVIYLLKQHHGQDCLGVTTKLSKQELDLLKLKQKIAKEYKLGE